MPGNARPALTGHGRLAEMASEGPRGGIKLGKSGIAGIEHEEALRALAGNHHAEGLVEAFPARLPGGRLLRAHLQGERRVADGAVKEAHGESVPTR